MACRARYVGGDTNKVAAKPNPSYPIEKGDLVFQHTDGMIRPVATLNGQGSAALDQLGAAKNFLGVADEKYAPQSGETLFHINALKPASISVCTTGRFEFACPSQTFTAQQSVGVYSDGTGIPDSQKVDSLQGAAALAQSIGIVALSEGYIAGGAAVTRVIVDIMGRRPLATAPVAGDYTGTSGM